MQQKLETLKLNDATYGKTSLPRIKTEACFSFHGHSLNRARSVGKGLDRCEFKEKLWPIPLCGRYLNYTLEKKETYFDALRDYFSSLVDYAAGEVRC